MNTNLTLTLNALSPIDEGSMTTLTGTIGDLQVGSTVTVDIDWGDPDSPDNEEQIEIEDGGSGDLDGQANGTVEFSRARLYLDDNPSATSQDTYTIDVTATEAPLIMGTDAVLVLDVSGSTDDPFSGDPVGDQNGDGNSNTILDAEIAAFKALNQDLIDRGLGNTANVSIVAFSSSGTQIDMNPAAAGIQLATTPLADNDNNGVRDVDQALAALTSGGGTNFEAALQDAISTLNAVGTPAGEGNVVFLSDGVSTQGGSFTDEVNTIANTLGQNLRAFGIGSGASLAQLQQIDPDAELLTSTNQLLDIFGQGGGGQVSDATTVLVQNVAPEIDADTAQVTVTEGETATNSGTFSDVGINDIVTLSASMGTVVDSGNGTWNWDFDPASSGVQQVTITATDDDGGQTNTTFDLTVEDDTELDITKDFDTESVVLGSSGSFTITVKNLGQSAETVLVEDLVSDSLTVTGITGGTDADTDGNVQTVERELTLAAGAESTITVDFDVPLPEDAIVSAYTAFFGDTAQVPEYTGVLSGFWVYTVDGAQKIDSKTWEFSAEEVTNQATVSAGSTSFASNDATLTLSLGQATAELTNGEAAIFEYNETSFRQFNPWGGGGGGGANNDSSFTSDNPFEFDSELTFNSDPADVAAFEQINDPAALLNFIESLSDADTFAASEYRSDLSTLEFFDPDNGNQASLPIASATIEIVDTIPTPGGGFTEIEVIPGNPNFQTQLDNLSPNSGPVVAVISGVASTTLTDLDRSTAPGENLVAIEIQQRSNFTFVGSNPGDTIDLSGVAVSFVDGNGALIDGTLTIDAGNGNDLVLAPNVLGAGSKTIVNGGNADDTLQGSDFVDELLGSNGNDVIDGGNGNNIIDGGNGNDAIDAGDGNDVIDGWNGKDVINSGAGDDDIIGWNGDDTIDAGDGNDVVDGGNGKDVINGGAGDDQILAGNGNDEIEGGAGADVLTGDDGRDRFIYTNLSDSLLNGFDRITDFRTNTDKIDGPNAVSKGNLDQLGDVGTLNEANIQGVLTVANFEANTAATFTADSGARTFLAINDGVAGFSAADDAIVEITGFSSNLSNLSII